MVDNKLTAMVKEHLGDKGPIVVKFVDGDSVIYMCKSVSRPNQAYNVVKENDKWYCDCPAFKYRKGIDKNNHCKHIALIVFLIKEKVSIEEI